VKNGSHTIVNTVFPDLKEKRFHCNLIINNTRRSFSLTRRDEQYQLALDSYSFTNPKTGETSEVQTEVEIEAKNQPAKRKLGTIRRNLVEILKTFSYSTDSKYERGIKYFGIEKNPIMRWLKENLYTPKGLALIAIIIAIVGIIITILLSIK
jgi:hypothetical protein